MPTTRETILAALSARLKPLAATVLRDEILPERIPPAGLITVTANGAYDTRRCHTAIIDRQAIAIIPIRRNGRP